MVSTADSSPDNALWVPLRNPGLVESVIRRFQGISLNLLLEGAYFGLNSQNIYAVDILGNLTFWENKKSFIVWNNPWVQKVSRFFSPIVYGSYLFCFEEKRWWTAMEHIEAQNAWFIQEVDYPTAIRYIGQNEVSDVVRAVMNDEGRRREFADWLGVDPDDILRGLEEPVYQVRRAASGRVIITDLEPEELEEKPVWMQYKI